MSSERDAALKIRLCEGNPTFTLQMSEEDQIKHLKEEIVKLSDETKQFKEKHDQLVQRFVENCDFLKNSLIGGQAVKQTAQVQTESNRVQHRVCGPEVEG